MAKRKLHLIDGEGLGKRLKEARDLLRLSMREVQEATDVPIASISGYEKGNPPTMANFSILAGFYIEEIEERRLASYFSFEYFMTGKLPFDTPQYFYISRSELAAISTAGLIYSGVVHTPKIRKTRSGEYLGFETDYGKALERLAQAVASDMSSFAVGIDVNKHGWGESALQDATVALDMAGLYGDRIRIDLRNGVSCKRMIEVLPDKYNESNFPVVQVNRYFKTPSFEERAKAASTCQYGVIRAAKPIIISEDDMLPSYSHGFR